MDFLFDIPVLGLIFQLVAYSVLVVTSNSTIILALATPIALGAMCGMMNERSGVVNIGIEGMMLASAFVGWYVASLVGQAVQADPSFFFGATPAIVIGVLAAIGTGLLISAMHAWLCISVRADQIISGTVINIVALGLTTYLNLLISKHSPPTGGKFDTFVPPAALVDLPVVGWIFRMFLQQGPITMSVIILAIVLQILLLRSRWGLRTRAVGEHPKAAETVGIDVIRLRYRNVILGGIFAGLAGAWFTLDYGNSFQAGMTNGKGFIALAALIFGRWHPIGAVAASLLFASAQSLGTAIRTTPPIGDLGSILGSIPEQVFQALPYVVTIIVLAGVVGRSVPPAAVGRPYERESTA
jgi:ABC-type uncharacterized transport system permease subunit